MLKLNVLFLFRLGVTLARASIARNSTRSLSHKDLEASRKRQHYRQPQRLHFPFLRTVNQDG